VEHDEVLGRIPDRWVHLNQVNDYLNYFPNFLPFILEAEDWGIDPNNIPWMEIPRALAANTPIQIFDEAQWKSWIRKEKPPKFGSLCDQFGRISQLEFLVCSPFNPSSHRYVQTSNTISDAGESEQVGVALVSEQVGVALVSEQVGVTQEPMQDDGVDNETLIKNRESLWTGCINHDEIGILNYCCLFPSVELLLSDDHLLRTFLDIDLNNPLTQFSVKDENDKLCLFINQHQQNSGTYGISAKNVCEALKALKSSIIDALNKKQSINLEKVVEALKLPLQSKSSKQITQQDATDILQIFIGPMDLLKQFQIFYVLCLASFLLNLITCKPQFLGTKNFLNGLPIFKLNLK
jgi:hypothetical protein